ETRPSVASSPMILRSVWSIFRRLSAFELTIPSFVGQDDSNAFDPLCLVRAPPATIQYLPSHDSSAGQHDRPNRCIPATGLLRRQRRLPLSRPVVRGPALRPRRRARRRVAAHRLSRARLGPLAPPLAEAERARPSRPAADRRARRGLRAHERLLLPLDR